VECGFDERELVRLSPHDQQRVQCIESLFDLLEDYPVEDGDDSLIHATMARIDQHDEQRAARMSIDPDQSERRGSRLIRLPDFISVAAVMLIAMGVAWPLIGKVRAMSIETACANNLRFVGQGLSAYSMTYDNALPVSQAAGLGLSWDRARNMNNLAPLIDLGFCEEGHLNCPGHDGAGTSYSYQLQLPGARSMLAIGRSRVVLGDRNPLIDAARIGLTAGPLSISPNHGARGQNLLYQDGSVMFPRLPKVGQDNVWLPMGVITLSLGDRLTDPTDAFLVH